MAVNKKRYLLSPRLQKIEILGDYLKGIKIVYTSVDSFKTGGAKTVSGEIPPNTVNPLLSVEMAHQRSTSCLAGRESHGYLLEMIKIILMLEYFCQENIV